ncbi:MAG TPA: argininosuccinate lyase [Terriglobales bacterium]|nr:argininosuccinate lyase [Terriglobales bacterium]
MKLWGGRFEQPADRDFELFSASFDFDRRLAQADVRGSRVHAEGLHRAGVLDDGEAASLAWAFDQLEAEFAEPPEAQPDVEDVHTYVFERLASMAGAAARKLQTGRSRNEQVALDLKLFLRDAHAALQQALGSLVAALAGFADEHAAVLIPGYTHMQRAQPISLGHHALAYAEMLLRDASRLSDASRRLDACPLGSGALAGSPWPMDREAAARALGFSAITENSLDATSDRDFAIETVFALSLMAVHLSRFAEDWILYASSEFGWLIPGDAFSTGSSLMPQKKNPDALELIRGKSARQIGHLTQMLVLLKGLPLAYNRDLQEDKESLFDALDTGLACLRIAQGVVATTRVDAARAAAAAADPALLATDLADLLVANGVPFHDAHGTVGAIITAAQQEGRDFRSFSAEELVRFTPALTTAAVATLTPEASVARRDLPGGTAVNQVRRQAQRVSERAAAMLR